MFLIPSIAVKSFEGKGRGVFATADIPGGTVIGEYVGFIQKPLPLTGSEAFHNMYYSDIADICPDPTTEGVHLINHSCEGNCASDGIGRRTVLFALRKIFAGEELGYDYFIGEQTSERTGGIDNCQSGSHFCRGTMYSNPKQYRRVVEWEEKTNGNLPEEPPVPYGEMLPPLESYPTEMEDDSLQSIFGAHNQEPILLSGTSIPRTQELRKIIRETGKQIKIPELQLIIRGVLFSGEQIISSL